jgi:hypothetical protein
MRRIEVFFYGLFMDQELLRQKGVDPQNPRTAELKDFHLVIGNRATLVPALGQSVHGIIFSLTHNQLDVLYSEPSVSLYRPEAVSAHLADGSIIPALCFNLPVPPSREERNPQYALRLRQLATRLSLPASYVSTIE